MGLFLGFEPHQKMECLGFEPFFQPKMFGEKTRRVQRSQAAVGCAAYHFWDHPWPPGPAASGATKKCQGPIRKMSMLTVDKKCSLMLTILVKKTCLNNKSVVLIYSHKYKKKHIKIDDTWNIFFNSNTQPVFPIKIRRPDHNVYSYPWAPSSEGTWSRYLPFGGVVDQQICEPTCWGLGNSKNGPKNWNEKCQIWNVKRRLTKSEKLLL